MGLGRRTMIALVKRRRAAVSFGAGDDPEQDGRGGK